MFNVQKIENYYALPKDIRKIVAEEKRNGKTQRELEEKYNISRATVYRYTHGIVQRKNKRVS